MNLENVKTGYNIRPDMVELIKKTEELKESLSKILTQEERMLKEIDLWELRKGQPYQHLFEAYWHSVDVLNDEIRFAADVLKNEVLDELVNKLT